MDIIFVKFIKYFKRVSEPPSEDETFIDYFYYFINRPYKRCLILSNRVDRMILPHKRFSHKLIESYINRPEWYRFPSNFNIDGEIEINDLYRLLNDKYCIGTTERYELKIISHQEV